MSSEPPVQERGIEGGRPRSVGRRVSPALIISIATATATATAASAAEAPPWLVQPAVQATISATTNGTGAASGEERKDIIASVQPTVLLVGESPAYKLRALLGADMVAYANGTQANRAYPLIDASATAVLAQRLLFLDSSVSVRAAERDPYAARSASGSTLNREIVSVYRVSPYLNYQISPASSVSARYEEISSHGDTESASNQRFSSGYIRLGRNPLPVGGSLEYETHLVRFSTPTSNQWRIDTLKAVGDFKIASDLIIGPVAGQERTQFLEDVRTDALYGAHLRWNPNERTQLTTEVDHRFFGVGWNLDLRHRTPSVTVLVQLSRAPVTSSTSIGVAPSGSALGSFLDQILTTRYPDAAARSTVVSNLIANRGLAADQQTPIDVRADYAQLQTDAAATVVFLGSRNIISVTLYNRTSRSLVRSGDALDELVTATADNRQSGLSIDFNRKLTPQLTADFTLTGSRIHSLGISGQIATREQTYRASLVRALSPKTGLSAGVQYGRLDSSATTVNSYTVISAFVGLSHRF